MFSERIKDFHSLYRFPFPGDTKEMVEPTLIDRYIYELKAAHLRYQFLLQRVNLLEKL